jgi:hypothetical protein
MSVDQLPKAPKAGTYKAYLADFFASSAGALGLGAPLKKAAWMKQQNQANKAAAAASKAATKAANQAALEAAKAAGAAAGSSLAAGFLPGETGGVPSSSTPFAGGAVSSTLGKVLVFALPLGGVALLAWWLLKKKRRK